MLTFSGNIPNHTPFLIESVAGTAGVFEVALAASELAKAPPPRLAAHAAVTEDFKNSRRVGGRMGNLNAIYLSQFSNPKPLWISSFLPRSLRVPCKLRFAPSCKRVRTRCRSEEHTSELQSHVNLVCRLLLEKKK